MGTQRSLGDLADDGQPEMATVELGGGWFFGVFGDSKIQKQEVLEELFGGIFLGWGFICRRKRMEKKKKTHG